MRSRRTSTAALAVVAVAALGIGSCGGSSGSPTAAVGIQSGEEGGAVTSSASVAKITICHKGNDLQVSPSALGGHLGHGDRLGSCAEVCPCFTSAGLAEVAAQCPAPPIASCGVPYSINLFCAPGGGGGSVGNLGYFEAKLGTGTCTMTTPDLMTGNDVTITLPVTAAEFEACKQAIVGNTYYPATCPR
ncbi:MAG TPA: hypothetical protein VLL75_07055 [Vicinamibacteria bacterium]|nr:hypothetical protein [Vicinamibacteria bacterium]